MLAPNKLISKLHQDEGIPWSSGSPSTAHLSILLLPEVLKGQLKILPSHFFSLLLLIFIPNNLHLDATTSTFCHISSFLTPNLLTLNHAREGQLQHGTQDTSNLNP